METALADSMNVQARDESLTVGAVVHTTERAFIDQVEQHPLGYSVRRSARWFTAIFAPIAPFFAVSLAREIRALDPDQINIHMPNLSAFWLLFLPSARARKWVVIWHSDVIPSRHSIGLKIFYRIYQKLEIYLLTKADRILATSPPYFETSVPLQRFRSKVECAPLTIDEERIPKSARRQTVKNRATEDELRLLCVGRLTYYKDFPTVIRAVALMPTARLRIVGDGEQRKELESVIEKYSLNDRVTLLGRVPDEKLWECYRWCDLLCVPSIERTEAFGIVILEAASFGKPSVVSNIEGSGMAWLIQKTEPRGYSFLAGNPEALAETLRRINEDPKPSFSPN